MPGAHSGCQTKATITDPCLFVKALFLIGQWLARNDPRYGNEGMGTKPSQARDRAWSMTKAQESSVLLEEDCLPS
jgi:hypothetical protein